MRPGARCLARGLALVLLLAGPPAAAPSPADGDEAVEDPLAPLSFLEGTWTARAFGGEAEETWLPPGDDAMFGIFRLTVDGRLRFSEFVQITVEGGRPVMRFAHFRPDYTTWEGEGRPMELALADGGESHAVFTALNPDTPDSIVYRRIGADRLDVRVTGIDGVLRFRRLP